MSPPDQTSMCYEEGCNVSKKSHGHALLRKLGMDGTHENNGRMPLGFILKKTTDGVGNPDSDTQGVFCGCLQTSCKPTLTKHEFNSSIRPLRTGFGCMGIMRFVVDKCGVGFVATRCRSDGCVLVFRFALQKANLIYRIQQHNHPTKCFELR